MCITHSDGKRQAGITDTIHAQTTLTHSLANRIVRMNMCGPRTEMTARMNLQYMGWELRRVRIYAINPRGKRCVVYHFFSIAEPMVFVIFVGYLFVIPRRELHFSGEEKTPFAAWTSLLIPCGKNDNKQHLQSCTESLKPYLRELKVTDARRRDA